MQCVLLASVSGRNAYFVAIRVGICECHGTNVVGDRGRDKSTETSLCGVVRVGWLPWGKRYILTGIYRLAFIAGPLIQCLGPGLTMPAMLAFHDSKLPFASDLGLFPSSMILGYILPLSFAALPAPGILAYDTKQQFIAIWQGWPLYTSLIMGVFRCLEVSQHRQLKTACAFAFACSAAGHLVFLWLSWAKTTSHHIYLPPAPWGEPQVTTLEAGVLRFLQWDYTCSACGMLVWTGATYRQATRKRSLRSFWALLIAGMVGVILLGPFSVAMVLYWETLTLVTTKGRQKL